MNFKTLGIILIALFVFQACEEIPTQDLNKVFKDKKIPKHLLRLQTQKSDLIPSREQLILKRSLEDAQRSDLVTVAVIDSGFDLYHPDLINQIQFDTKDGKIIAAGYNFMTNQPFASHYAIDASLYSLMANKTSFQSIDELKEPTNPLSFLKQVNDEFQQLLLDGIRQDAELSKSYFGFIIRKESFHFLSFREALLNYDKDLLRYENLKKNYKLLSLNSVPTDEDSVDRKKELDFIKSAGLKMDLSGEATAFFKFSSDIEHYDKLLSLIRSISNNIEQKYKIESRLENLAKFSNQDHKSKKDESLEDAVKKISKTMPLILFGQKIHDPIFRLEYEFSRTMGYENLSLAESLHKYKTDIEINIQEHDKYFKDKDAKEIQNLKNSLLYIDNLIHAFNSITENEQTRIKYLSELRRLTYRQNHPFLSPYSSSNAHGTHVAATIAAQSKNIRILPIAITTASRSLTDEEFKNLQNEFFNMFNEFKKGPYYPLLITRLYGEFPTSRKLSEKTIDTLISNYMKKQKLNLAFIFEFLKSIKYVGESNAKIASVSLGTVFEKKIGDSKWKESLAEELFSEFMRYKAGEYIESYAKETLFLIASGNDKAWIDGVTRTAIPVGIVSQRLHEIAIKNNLPTSPNNRIDNILAVGSVSERGYLSQFTNFSIGKIKQIFSVGEDVTAAIPRNNSVDRSKKIASKLMAIFSGVLKINLNSYREDRLKLKEIPSLQLHTELANFTRLSYSVLRDKMSGTSMATPNTSGSIAKRIVQMMRELNVAKDQLKTHPEFTPSKLIAELYRMATPLPISQDGALSGLYKDIKKITSDPTDKLYKKFETQLLSKPKISKLTCNQIFN